MKVIFLVPYPHNEVASQRFRFEQYYDILKEEGILFTYRSFYTKWFYKVLYTRGKYILKISGLLAGFVRRIFHVFETLRYDSVFIHRELAPLGPPLFEWTISRLFQKKIIYDFDDAIWLQDPSGKRSLITLLKWHSKVSRICSWSFRISCGNDFLAGFARRYCSQVTINPTTIDISASRDFLSDHDGHPLTIGWTGTHSTLPYLHGIIKPVRKILAENPGMKFLVICNRQPDFHFAGLDFKVWEMKSELKDLQKIHVGLMPLPDTDWARGKCGFKILQYFSLGIPAIASPVGVNRNMIREGVNGFLCTDENSWYNRLNQLISNTGMRKKFGILGREIVRDHYSNTANRTNFLRLFE